jgi:hypothetical protein
MNFNPYYSSVVACCCKISSVLFGKRNWREVSEYVNLMPVL